MVYRVSGSMEPLGFSMEISDKYVYAVVSCSDCWVGKSGGGLL